MMTLRFMQTVDSDVPDLPFIGGQVISVTAPTPRMQQWIRDGVLVIVGADPDDVTSLGPPPRTATLKRRRSRGARA